MSVSSQRLFGAHRFDRRAPIGGAAGGTDPLRRSLIAKVKIAAKELGLPDDDYRAVLLRVTSRRSAADCSVAELTAMVEEFKRKGWQPSKGGRTPKAADHPAAFKARAMWISLHQLGAIDNPSDQALEVFAAGRLECARMQWADQALMYKVIEGLKKIGERHGWAQDLAGVDPSAKVLVLKRRLVAAILAKLKALDFVPAEWDEARAAYEFGGIEIRGVVLATASELDGVAGVLGAALRDAKAAQA